MTVSFPSSRNPVTVSSAESFTCFFLLMFPQSKMTNGSQNLFVTQLENRETFIQTHLIKHILEILEVGELRKHGEDVHICYTQLP